MSTCSDPVLFGERSARGGARIGIATLNAPQTLNALSLPMINLLDDRLARWADDPAVAAIVLDATGDKAFCAGGDLQELYASMLRQHASPRRADITANAYAVGFFAREYRLDYRIHSYPKPILCWGHGIVMGGGVGLMAGASHRVVTERSKVAMPEISIGLYPDVGGSWLLGRAPGKLGLFLALTGAPLGGEDARFIGMAHYRLPHERKAHVVERMLAISWEADRSANDRHLAALLLDCALRDDPAACPTRRHFDEIEALCERPSLPDIVGAIVAGVFDDPWLQRAATTLAAGSPGAIALAHAMQNRARAMSLADVFRMELVASLHCAAGHDFAEGIRALLIDKDRRPRWDPATLDAASPAWIGRFFESPWHADEHPLARLGCEAVHA